MVALAPAGGPLQQLANSSFFMAACVSDVLLIRLFLVCAYCFLIAAAASGMPSWASVASTGQIFLDTLLWASITLAFHALSLLRLLWDERRVRFAGEDEEQLWRFFHRRSGMGRLEMAEVLRFGGWRRVPAGSPVLRRGEERLRFCLLVEGTVLFQPLFQGEKAAPTLMRSGSCFDIALLNVFGVFLGLEKGGGLAATAMAETDCLLYTWSIGDLEIMATQLAPAVSTFWRNFALCTLGLKLTWDYRPDKERICAMGLSEDAAVQRGGRSRDFTDPLRDYERGSASLAGVLRWFINSLHPFPPRGMRHTALPTTGVLARNRAIAMKVAQTRALIERDSSTACSSEAEWAGLSERGGQAAFELLAGLPTLQRLNAVRAEELAASTCAHCSHLLHAPDVEQAAGSPKRAERRPLSAPTSPARHGWRLGDSL